MTTQDLKAPTHKVCNICEIDKPIEKFWRSNSYPDRRWKYCSLCANLSRATSPNRKENGGAGRSHELNKLKAYLATQPVSGQPDTKALRSYFDQVPQATEPLFPEVVSIQVTDSVPIPDEALQFVYPFETMKVGDSFGFAESEYGQVLRALTGTASSGASYYTSPDKLRCWRVR